MDCNPANLDTKITCRTCLGQNKDMTNMTTNNEILIKMFVAVTNLEFNPTSLYSCICNNCEEKLNTCYNFQKQCQNSNEVLLECLNLIKDETIKEDNDVTEYVKEETFENVKEETFENVDEDSDYKPQSETKKKQTMRLVQFSYDKVTQAIKDCRRTFFENTQCIRCGFIGSNIRALSGHITHLHKDLKGKWCSKCNSEFDNLAEHQQDHGEDDLKCQFCDKVFQTKGHLIEHLRSHCDVRPFKCDACEKCFISQRHLKVHSRIHSNEKPYKCVFCTNAFAQRNSLKIHMKQHDKHNKYYCTDCNTKCKNKQSSDEHLCLKYAENAKASNPQMIVIAQNFCVECNKKVKSLTMHRQRFHSDCGKDGNEYNDNVSDNKLCSICAKQFKTASKLRVHMRIHTGEAPYKCSFCDKRVTTRNQLVVHERIHTGERPHVCHICGKGFAQSSVLNTHLRLHTGRPEVCKICEQRFCRPAELRLHMRKHTGEKPYLCTECGQAFIQRSHLVEHNKTHSDARPYQCNYCEKAFKQSSSLKTHIQIHTGFKPFKCSQCSYACRQSYSLTQHMKLHDIDAPRSDRPHICFLCNRTYTTHAMLMSHAEYTHNVHS